MYKYVNEIINELREESSSLKKQEIIQKYQNNKEFLEVIKLALDPMITFGIKQIPEYDVGRGNIYLTRALKKLDLFINRTYTGNAAKKQLRQLLESVEFADAQVLELIFKKSLDCGVSIKTVNKALGYDLIEEFGVNTCHKFNEKTKLNITYPAQIEEKMDGCLSGGWVVEFEDGSSELLSDVVHNKINKKIKSYDTISNDVVYNRIIDWSLIENGSEHDWYIIEGDNFVTKELTGNHKIWCSNKHKWIRTDELEPGDKIIFD